MNSFPIHMLGRVRAGPPTFSPPDEEVFDFAEFFCAPNRFMLRVRGDDLHHAGIRHGDLLLIRHRTRARSGDLVLALVDGQDTQLRFYRHPPGHIELYCEPGQSVSYTPQRIQIQGVLIAQLRLWRH